MNNIPCIALVGNPPADKCEILNDILDKEGLTELCDIIIYGADGQAENEALNDAIEDYRDGKVDGIVCLPLQKPMKQAFIDSLGEEADKTTELTIHTTSRLTSVMGGMDIADTAVALTTEAIIDKATALSKILKRDLSILNPRIAVLSLNNEIATNETSEEINIIAPAVTNLVNSGIQAFGPIACGEIFENNAFMAYDAILAMYDTQVKELFTSVSNELPFTILSGLDIPVAQAEPENILKACYATIDIAHNRKEYDRPFRNPLQKLFHERREDGDKARFAIKKKGFNPAEHRRENVTFVTLPPKDKAESSLNNEK